MNDNEHSELLHSINRGLGELTGEFRGLKEHVEKQNNRITKVEKKQGLLDVALGKVGVVVAGVLFVASLLGKVIFEWIVNIVKNGSS